MNGCENLNLVKTLHEIGNMGDLDGGIYFTARPVKPEIVITQNLGRGNGQSVRTAHISQNPVCFFFSQEQLAISQGIPEYVFRKRAFQVLREEFYYYTHILGLGGNFGSSVHPLLGQSFG